MPSRFLRILLFSSRWRAWSFFDIAATVPFASRSSSSFRRSRRLRIVRKLVSVPPSQRSVTYGMPVRCAAARTASRAERFVPTNRIFPPSEATSLRKCDARTSPFTVSLRSMMWIVLRLPWMNGFIFGFHRLARCPK